MLSCDAACQDCKQSIWKVALRSVFGYIYLCGECAAFLLDCRDSDKPGLQRKYDDKARKIANSF